MNYKYHYVYRITNITTHMYYYGDRSCNCHPSEDIGIKYFSSFGNKLFKQDQLNNPQDYNYKVIKIFETCRKDAKQLEADLHSYFDVKNHIKFINRANQTSSGFDTTGCIPSWNYGLTKGTSEILKHSAINQSIYAKNRPISHNQKLGRNQEGHNNTMYDKIHQESTKTKMSIKRKEWASTPENIDLLSYNAKKLSERMKSTIEKNGKTQMQNSREKQVKTVKETICDNGKTIEENSQLKRIKTIKQNQSNIGERNSMAKYFKVVLLDGSTLYFWTKTFEDWRKLNAIRPSDLDRSLNDNNILFSNTKISSKFYNHQMKGTKIYKITREEYFSN